MSKHIALFFNTWVDAYYYTSHVCHWKQNMWLKKTFFKWCPSVPKKRVHLEARLSKNKCWITRDGFNLRCLWSQPTCVSQLIAHDPSPRSPGVQGWEGWVTPNCPSRTGASGGRKRHNTYKNFPFVFDPIRTICSDSSREIFPWNQGIFSHGLWWRSVSPAEVSGWWWPAQELDPVTRRGDGAIISESHKKDTWSRSNLS